MKRSSWKSIDPLLILAIVVIFGVLSSTFIIGV
jgi:hypothetical protein